MSERFVLISIIAGLLLIGGVTVMFMVNKKTNQSNYTANPVNDSTSFTANQYTRCNCHGSQVLPTMRSPIHNVLRSPLNPGVGI
jgi:flagellar basal body-associated protein FliL